MNRKSRFYMGISTTDISMECGFRNFSHFNKLLKEYAGKNASEYREDLNRVVQ